jgi:hypothetical protein
MEIASPFDNFEYVLIPDEGKEPDKQRKLKGRYLTVREQATIADISSAYTRQGDRTLNTGTSNLMAVHFGLLEMINFKDRNGNPIKLERNQSSNDLLPNGEKPLNETMLEYIPPVDFMVFAAKIRNGGDLEEAEAKN